MLWESAGAFFPRDNSLISRGNSHVSRVRGLVVRCLLFNPEVSCSNPWVCANFFYKYSEAEGSDFFGTMRLFGFVRLFFGFERLFFENLFFLQRVPLQLRQNVYNFGSVPLLARQSVHFFCFFDFRKLYIDSWKSFCYF